MVYLEVSRRTFKSQCILDAATFYHKYLKIDPDYDVVISYDKTIKGWHGYATFDDAGWYVEIGLNPRHKQMNQLLTLAHEMIHAKQYLSGELKNLDINKNLCLWKGKEYTETEENYYDLPWEVEAHSREKELYTKMRKKLDFIWLPAV
jgi:hypothetical protein